MSDEDDDVYTSIHQHVEDNQKQLGDPISGSKIHSVLRVFAHGKRDSMSSRILFNKGRVDEEKEKELAGYDVTIIHSCHSGYVEGNPLGDFGGLPGFFFSHGSKLVVAPVAHIHPKTAAKFDDYLTAWMCEPKRKFSDAYLGAIKERPDMAYYSVYGDPWDIDKQKLT